MASKNAFELNAEIKVKLDQLKKDLKSVEQEIKKTGKKVDKQVGGLGSDIANKFAKVFASAGTFELGLASAASVFKGMRGDMDGMLQAAEALPAGLGPAIRAARMFSRELTGQAFEEEKNKKAKAAATGGRSFGQKLDLAILQASGKSLEAQRLAVRQNADKLRAEARAKFPGIDKGAPQPGQAPLVMSGGGGGAGMLRSLFGLGTARTAQEQVTSRQQQFQRNRAALAAEDKRITDLMEMQLQALNGIQSQLSNGLPATPQ